MSKNPLKKRYSEEAVLKILDIPDFRHLTKDKAIEFVSMIPQMDPEVAIKALEQFPQLKDAALGMAKEYKEAMVKAIDADNDDAKALYATIDAIITSLQKELSREEISVEERHFIIEQMKDLAQFQHRAHKENQDFKVKIMGIGGGVVAVLGLALVAVLGGSGRISLPGLDDVIDR